MEGRFGVVQWLGDYGESQRRGQYGEDQRGFNRDGENQNLG